VLSIELVLSKGSERKIFRSFQLSNGAQDSRSLLTPISIAGRSSFSGVLIFVPVVARDPALVDAAGDYPATFACNRHSCAASARSTISSADGIGP
jgi:hypothetical protein